MPILDHALIDSTRYDFRDADAQTQLVTKADAIRATANGAIAHIADGAVGPLSLDIVINPKQQGSGDPSPENERAISSHTSVTLIHAGKNLFNDDGITYPQTVRGVTATKNSDGSITFTGSPNGGTNGTQDSVFAIAYGADQHLKAGEQYVLSGCPAGGSTTTYRAQIAAIGSWLSDIGNGVTFEAPAGAWSQQSIRVSFKPGTTIPEGGLTFKPMIRPAIDSNNTYKPYNGTEHEIALPNDAGTVYGGNLHINPDGSGVLTVSWGILKVEDKTWEYNSTYTRFRATVSDMKVYPGNRITPFYCSQFKNVADGRGLDTMPDNAIYGAGNSSYVYIKCTNYATPEAFVAAYKDVQIVYPLANPSTYNLTATQMTSLFGENNVWADTGDVSVNYYADTTTYIHRLTQPDDDMVSDSNISIGKFFMVGNELYIATSGIATGETIIPGTNCTKMSLAQALNNINA